MNINLNFLLDNVWYIWLMEKLLVKSIIKGGGNI